LVRETKRKSFFNLFFSEKRSKVIFLINNMKIDVFLT
jgi:hypothetical protein